MKHARFWLTIMVELFFVFILSYTYQYFWIDALFTIGVLTFSVLLLFLLNIKTKTGQYTAYQRAGNGYEAPVENRWPIVNPIILAAACFGLLSLLVSGIYYLGYLGSGT
ncbi:hypothetical protein ACFQPF_00950 [Fictibacillus iocasae]|uniref:Uncharacterized protein n=1 Tax=Fictibacillus iocasae TaxID=2715437 RepID=A0ABW2NLR9_9BACL